MKGTCSVPQCDRPVQAVGMCSQHYQRARKYGDPLFMHTIECVRCGDVFEAKSSVRKYCASACRYADKMDRDGLTCADCGKPVQRGRTSRPQGLAQCSECRNDGRGYFVAPDGGRFTHGLSAYRAGCRCVTCTETKSGQMQTFFAKHKAEHGEHWSTTRRRQFRAEHGYWPQGRGGYWVDGATRHAIYERDGWVCQLCGGPVDPEAAPGSPSGASLDHIVPQSAQLVPDHRPSNLRLAHHGCNARRGARLDLEKGVA